MKTSVGCADTSLFIEHENIHCVMMRLSLPSLAFSFSSLSVFVYNDYLDFCCTYVGYWHWSSQFLKWERMIDSIAKSKDKNNFPSHNQEVKEVTFKWCNSKKNKLFFSLQVELNIMFSLRVRLWREIWISQNVITRLLSSFVLILHYCVSASRYGQSCWGDGAGCFCLSCLKRWLVPPGSRYCASQVLSARLHHTCAKL